jgi:hypothetical protein
VTKESAQRLFCSFAMQLSKTDSCWYSLLFLFDNCPSVASLFGISQSDLLQLLELAGWVQTYSDRDPVLKMNAFKEVIHQPVLCDILEYSHFRLERGGKTAHFIRIGKKFEKGCAIRHPTDTRNQPKRRPFLPPLQKAVRVFVKAVTARRRTPQEAGTSGTPIVESPGTINDVVPSIVHEQEEHNKKIEELLRVRLSTKLLPLVIQPEMLASERVWNESASLYDVEQALIDLVAEVRKLRDDRASTILGIERMEYPQEDDAVPAEDLFPVLRRYNIPIDDPFVHESVLRELFKVNKLRTGKTTMYVNLGDNKQTAMVCIPRSKNLDRIQRNARLFGGWFELLLDALSDDGDRQEAFTNLVQFLGGQAQYNEGFTEAIENLGICTIPTLDEATTFAIQSSSNINYNQWRELRRNLKVVLGVQLFSGEHKIKQLVGSKFLIPTTGVYRYGNEPVTFSYKCADEILLLYLTTLMTEMKGEQKIDHIDCVVSIDHGKGVSRATLVIVIRWLKEDGTWEETEQGFALASATCRKDNRDILENTYVVAVNDALKRIRAEGRCSFFKDSDEDGYYTVLGGGPPRNPDDELVGESPIECWIAGDFLFFAMALGKEGSASYWCAYCDQSHKLYQPEEHEKGALWTLQLIMEHFEKLESGELNGKVPAERRGVKTRPLLDAVDVDHYVLCTLHIQIGTVNDLYNNLIAEVQAGMEGYTDEYLIAEGNWVRGKGVWEEAKSEFKEFQRLHAQYEKELRRQLRSNTAMDDEATENLQAEIDFIVEERKELQNTVIESKEIAEVWKSEFNDEQAMSENSKAFGQPVRAQIEDILCRHKISRGAYHGGDIQGNGCRTLMTRRTEIMGDIRNCLLGIDENQRKHCSIADIDLLCDVTERGLGHLDALFSILRARRFHVDDAMIRTAEAHRDQIMALYRHLKMSITPKLHCVEDHAIYLLRQHLGFGDIGEDAGERAHQEGTKNEERVAAVKTLAKKELTKSQFEVMKYNPGVKIVSETIQKKGKRKFKEGRIADAASSARNKKYTRDTDRAALLLLPVMTGTMNRMRDIKVHNLRLEE